MVDFFCLSFLYGIRDLTLRDFFFFFALYLLRRYVGDERGPKQGVGLMRKYGLLFVCLLVSFLFFFCFVWRYYGAVWELLLYIHMIFFLLLLFMGFLLYGELLCVCFFFWVSYHIIIDRESVCVKGYRPLCCVVIIAECRVKDTYVSCSIIMETLGSSIGMDGGIHFGSKSPLSNSLQHRERL